MLKQPIYSRSTKWGLFLLVLICSSSLLSSFKPDEPYFYYAFGRKIYLQPNYEKLVVVLKATDSAGRLTSKANSFRWHNNKTLELTFNSKEGSDEARAVVQQYSGVASINPVYVVEGRMEKYLTNEIVVGFKRGTLVSEIPLAR